MVEKFKFSCSLKLVENTLELMKQSIVIELCEHLAYSGLVNRLKSSKVMNVKIEITASSIHYFIYIVD